MGKLASAAGLWLKVIFSVAVTISLLGFYAWWIVGWEPITDLDHLFLLLFVIFVSATVTFFALTRKWISLKHLDV